MYKGKTTHNWGSLCRTAQLLNASYMATIGSRFRKQASDTMRSWRHVPIFQHETFEDFYRSIPYDCQLIGVEMTSDAVEISQFEHPQRAVYLLGSEDNGLPPDVLERCHKTVCLRGERSMNVAVAGSIVIYDRVSKAAKPI